MLSVVKALKNIEGIDTSNFSNVAGNIDTSDVNAISYCFTMVFKMTTPPDNTLPSLPIDIELEMEVNENLQNTNETICGEYAMQLQLNSVKGGEHFMCCWHLDLDPGTERRYMHPRFHLTFGGKNMREKYRTDHDAFGHLMMMATPRIPCAPMDSILAIDFVLDHFYRSDDIADVLNNTKYREAVKESQKRIWCPYYKTISDSILKQEPIGNGLKYLPNLILSNNVISK